MRIGAILCFLLVQVVSTACWGRELVVTTWNLGWHLSQAEASTWIAKCGAPFARKPGSKIWEPAEAGTSGWELTWGRDAKILWDIGATPPCDVFKTLDFKIVPVTKDAYRKRAQQIGDFIGKTLKPDVIAFQEVSGEQAVREVLPNGGADYNVCSFSEFKVQRLAFAWRKELGDAVEPCKPEKALSLPALPQKDQVRPGLSIGLKVDGKLIRFLNVHLKSSCVSPLEAKTKEGKPDSNGKGALAGTNEACSILQQQVAPIEAWVEAKTQGSDHLVLLGDFNRNLWHESHLLGASPVRSDESDPKKPLGKNVRVSSLIGEVNDGEPSLSTLALLNETCDVTPNAAALCQKAELGVLDSTDAKSLSSSSQMGCRNPVGLDHILISSRLTADNGAHKVALGNKGRTLPANPSNPDPLLGLSDHCPLQAVVKM